jgi:hypothetical protein
VLGVAFAIVCILKGKAFMAIVGLFVPLVGLIGAVRPAKPGSRWDRRRRATGPPPPARSSAG